jgi:CRISPR-associated protein Csx10
LNQTCKRDRDGLPYLPASTLIGLLREHAWAAAEALDGDQFTLWREWHTYVFGSDPAGERFASAAPEYSRAVPTPAALRGTSLHLPPAARKAIARAQGVVTSADLCDSAFVIRPGIKINDRTGTASEDFLRAEERARAGLLLEASDWEIAFPASFPAVDRWPAALLVASAARLIRGIGGKRRRGAGQVDLHAIRLPGLVPGSSFEATDPNAFDGQFDEGLAKWFEAANGEVPHPPRETAEPRISDPMRQESPSPSDTFLHEPAPPPPAALAHRFNLDIETTSPVLVNVSTKGNTTTSAQAIPGAVLMGIVGHAIGKGFDGLVRDAQIIVTPAYPVVDEVRAVPWPLSLGRLKYDDGNEFVNACSPQESYEPLRPPDEPYLVHLRDGRWSKAGADLVIEARTVVDDASGRTQADRGGPYTIVALAPGQQFRAEIWATAELTRDLTAIDAKTERIGKKSKADYGRATVSWSKPPAANATVLPIAANTPFTLYAESDLVVPGPNGTHEPTPEALVAAVQAALRAAGAADGIAVKMQPVEVPATGRQLPHADCALSGSATPTADCAAPLALAGPAFWYRVIRTESWQKSWGLPRPSILAIAAGSVFRLIATEEIPGDVVAALSAAGLGWRRAEGFGRVAINSAALTKQTLIVEPAATTSSSPTPTDSDRADPVYRRLARVAWKNAIVDRARTLAENTAEREKYVPGTCSPSQRGTLRELISGAGSRECVTPDEMRQWPDALGTPWSGAVKNLETLLAPGSWDSEHILWTKLFPGEPLQLKEYFSETEIAALTQFAVRAFLIEALRDHPVSANEGDAS